MAYHVLIVDDSTTMRKILVRGLRQAQLDVASCREAKDGGEGLSALQAGTVDLVLLDLEMPDMSGADFVRKVGQQFDPPPPIVLLASDSNSPGALEALRSGASGCLEKPFTPDRLHDVLERYLDIDD